MHCPVGGQEPAMFTAQPLHSLLQRSVLDIQIVDLAPKLSGRSANNATAPHNSYHVSGQSLQRALKCRHGGHDLAHAWLTKVGIFPETEKLCGKPLERHI